MGGGRGVRLTLSQLKKNERMTHTGLSIYNEQSKWRGNQTLHLQAWHMGSDPPIRLILGEHEVRTRIVVSHAI